MKEINLLKNYPITKRNLDEAIVERTDEVRQVARRFDKDFFDGERNMATEAITIIQDFGQMWWKTLKIIMI